MLAVLGQNVTSVYTCSLRSFCCLEKQETSCLPFTWPNKSVHGLRKWYKNSGLVNFFPESRWPFVQTVPFTEKTTYREGLKLVSKMALKKWKKIPVWNISDVPLVPEIFRQNDPESRRFYLLYKRVSRNATSAFINGK